mgnify:CR=1 FL=1
MSNGQPDAARQAVQWAATQIEGQAREATKAATAEVTKLADAYQRQVGEFVSGLASQQASATRTLTADATAQVRAAAEEGVAQINNAAAEVAKVVDLLTNQIAEAAEAEARRTDEFTKFTVAEEQRLTATGQQVTDAVATQLKVLADATERATQAREEAAAKIAEIEAATAKLEAATKENQASEAAAKLAVAAKKAVLDAEAEREVYLTNSRLHRARVAKDLDAQDQRELDRLGGQLEEALDLQAHHFPELGEALLKVRREAEAAAEEEADNE